MGAEYSIEQEKRIKGIQDELAHICQTSECPNKARYKIFNRQMIPIPKNLCHPKDTSLCKLCSNRIKKWNFERKKCKCIYTCEEHKKIITWEETGYYGWFTYKIENFENLEKELERLSELYTTIIN